MWSSCASGAGQSQAQGIKLANERSLAREEGRGIPSAFRSASLASVSLSAVRTSSVNLKPLFLSHAHFLPLCLRVAVCSDMHLRTSLTPTLPLGQ